MNRTILAALMIILSCLTAWAGGLRTPFGEVVVSGLKIGQTYSMHKLLNLPLRVVNTGDAPIDLWVETVRSTSLNTGYEEIPSPDWVKVERGSFTISPNREAVTDLLIAIPNDTALLGRRFQADIWSHSVEVRAVLVGLKSRLLLHIDSTPPTEEELKNKFVDETLANLDFTIMPVNAAAKDIPLGRDISLRKERKLGIKMINPNDRALNFRVRSLPVWESMITPPPGYEAAYKPQWLKPEKDIVKVDGNSIAETGMILNIPDEARYRGKKFFFIVSFEVLEQKIATRVFYRLLVDTTNEATAAPKK